MNLADRMKMYENAHRIYLPRRMATIIRVDGVAFHTYTKGMRRPFDKVFRNTMQLTAEYLKDNIQGCELAYVQSDEISLFLQDYHKLETQSWHGKNIQKMTSVAASMATVAFNRFYRKEVRKYREYNENDYVEAYISKIDTAFFDGRAFILPKEEVKNYFIWRQRDCIRNSVLSVGQHYFSHKSLQGIKVNNIIEKLYDEEGINYEEKYTDAEKYGVFYTRKDNIKGFKQSVKIGAGNYDIDLLAERGGFEEQEC